MSNLLLEVLAVLFIETDVSHEKLHGFQATVGKMTFVF